MPVTRPVAPQQRADRMVAELWPNSTPSRSSDVVISSTDFHYTRRFSKADEIIAFRIARRERLGERLSRQLQGEGHPALLGYPMRARNFEIVCAHRLGREGHPAIFGVAPVDLAISLRSAAADRNRSQTTGQTVPALPPAPCRSGHEPRLSVL